MRLTFNLKFHFDNFSNLMLQACRGFPRRHGGRLSRRVRRLLRRLLTRRRCTSWQRYKTFFFVIDHLVLSIADLILAVYVCAHTSGAPYGAPFEKIDPCPSNTY